MDFSNIFPVRPQLGTVGWGQIGGNMSSKISINNVAQKDASSSKGSTVMLRMGLHRIATVASIFDRSNFGKPLLK